MSCARVALCASVLMFAAGTAWADPAKGVSAKAFGAAGDGLADDTAAIQKALDSLPHEGGVVHLPAGSYRLSAALRVPEHVALLGEGSRWETMATRLIVPANGFSAVRLSHGSSVKALCISYPNNQNIEQPTAYPPSILLKGINPSVENIVFDGAWIGVSTPPAGYNAGQGLFRDLTGFVHSVGIHLSGCRDVNRIEDVHWFSGGRGDFEKSYFRNNRVGFEFGDVDGVLMSGCFLIGGKTFLHQLPKKDGPNGQKEVAHSLGFHIVNSWIEDVENGFIFEGMTGFVLNSANILVRGGVGVRVHTSGLYYNAVLSGVQVRPMPQSTGLVGFDYNPTQPHPRNRLSIADCQVTDATTAVRLGPGAQRVNIHDSHFQVVGDRPAIEIARGADLLLITNNVLSAKRPLLDESDPKARKNISGNVYEQ
jgi:hypothetical protein